MFSIDKYLIDPCELHQCGQNAECELGPKGPECKCKAGCSGNPNTGCYGNQFENLNRNYFDYF